MKCLLIVALCVVAMAVSTVAVAYPPAVGIAGKSPSCAVCHADTGPWGDEAKTIVDILDEAVVHPKRAIRTYIWSFAAHSAK